MEWFLLRNGFELHASNDEMVAFALAVALNDLSREDSEGWVRRHASRESWSPARHERWRREARASR